MERERIMQVMEKYSDYFREWDADVAFGVKGKHIFYVLDENHNFETFMFFRTAEQLELIILGTLAENIDCILDAGLEEIYMEFSKDDVDEKSTKSLEYYLPILIKKLEAFHTADQHWSQMMNLTFLSLRNVCTELMEKKRAENG